MGLWKCLAYMAAWGILCFPLGRLINRLHPSWEKPPFRTMDWERGGAAYELIGVRAWKNLAPDVSRFFPQIVPRKGFDGRPDAAKLEDMLLETCVAETVHWLLSLTGLIMLWLWPGAGGVAVYAVYVILGNLPFIVIQRYNRPRFARMLNAVRARERRRTDAGSDTVEQ